MHRLLMNKKYALLAHRKNVYLKSVWVIVYEIFYLGKYINTNFI